MRAPLSASEPCIAGVSMRTRGCCASSVWRSTAGAAAGDAAAGTPGVGAVDGVAGAVCVGAVGTTWVWLAARSACRARSRSTRGLFTRNSKPSTITIDRAIAMIRFLFSTMLRDPGTPAERDSVDQ